MKDDLMNECFSIDEFDKKLRQNGPHSRSSYSHHKGSLASFKGSPFITGGLDGGLKTELYRGRKQWIAKPDFPTQYTNHQNR